MISKSHFNFKKDGTPNKKCFCRSPELIENYDKAIADITQIWVCHHKLETHNSDGEKRLVDLSICELKALGAYYDRPPEELIFLTRAEHRSLHAKGRALGEKTKAKISTAKKGKPTWNKGKFGYKTQPCSEETKAKISDAHKGMRHSEEAKAKMSASRKGKHWKLVDGKRVYY